MSEEEDREAAERRASKEIMRLLAERPGMTAAEVIEHFFPCQRHGFGLGVLQQALIAALYYGKIDMTSDRKLTIAKPQGGLHANKRGAGSSPVDEPRTASPASVWGTL